METPTAWFEERWSASADPFGHGGGWCSTRRDDLTLAALPRARYAVAVEPACGTGALTERLAERADRVAASDRFAAAVAATATRCRRWPHVTVAGGDVRDGPAVPGFDLVVLGDVLHYFDAATVADVVRRWHLACAPGGHVVLAHHRGPVAEHVLGGDDVHAIAADLLDRPTVSVVDPAFRLDVFDAPAR